MSDLTKALKNKLLTLAISGQVSIVCDEDNANYNEMIREFSNGTTNVYANITDAVGNLRSNCGDAVVITSGSYAPSASIAIAKSNIKIMGLSIDGMGADVSIAGASDADEIFNVNANKVSFEGLRLNCYSTTKNGIAFGETAVCYYSSVKNCRFNGGATQIEAANTFDSPELVIDGCTFRGATTASVNMNVSWGMIDNARFNSDGIATTDVIHIGDATNAPSRDDMEVRNSTINGTATATDAIDIDGGSNCVLFGVLVSGCTNNLVDAGTATEAVLSYEETNGGTLIAP